MTDRHLDDDELIDVALGSDDLVARERMTAHLAGCADCHARYRDLDESMRAALLAAPSVAPPAGFSARVLAAGSQDTESPRRQRWGPLVVALAALLGVAVGITGTLSVTGTQPSLSAPVTVASGPLQDRDGDDVGTAALTRVGGEPYLVVSVVAGRPGVVYECFMVDAEGNRTSGGTWQLDQSYGSAEESGVWLVPLDDQTPASVELQVESGQVWARATF